ncbi:Hemerythrin HHE cation binding domain-containing protein [Paraburkholderia fungorum]|uniref:Hemerythrin HHE cation binding domain-containing protein n=1 Tax=Paraburkholderia fungorum TaxID=134537 RepID=A0A1H1JVF8_9BURK|nr:hemerythrin domain-containing protein [Paraburkholderia fungorum]SDR54023.1 Hemerythrin HHE cation binding domain-containing protein [Paraburkholderia fungorum]
MKTHRKATPDVEVSKRNPASSVQDAISVLIADHRAVQTLFDAFKRADEHDLDRKGTLVRRACEELSIHAMVEEELLYPAAQEALDEDKRPDVEEAFVEHYLVKVLIEKFSTLKPGQKGFDATFKVLTEMVSHHIEEEESELFPALRKSNADLETLGAEITKRKAALEAKLPNDVGDRTTQLH